jgi:PAS domain S-box-containing protein
MKEFKYELDLLKQKIQELSSGKGSHALLKKSHQHYKTIFQNLPFIAFTLDRKGRIVEGNPYTEKVMGMKLKQVKGKGFFELGLLDKKNIFKAIREFKKNLSGKVTGKTIYEIWKKNNKKLSIELIGIPLQKEGIVYEVLDVGQDITEQLRITREREKLIYELKESLDKINTLKGLLPICPVCKKIKDDEGYWHQVENYLNDHSDVEFSHAICPECFKKLYPDMPVE